MEIQSDFYIKIKRDYIKIDKSIFIMLLDNPTIKSCSTYKKAISKNQIKIKELKKISEKAYVPYPLFFAPKEKVINQVKDNEINLIEKLPTKEEMQLALRGDACIRDLEIIVKDIGRKQEFLKRRILTHVNDNAYTGSLKKQFDCNIPIKDIAKQFREYFNIKFDEIRKLPKDNVLKYICNKAEEKNIFIAMSSYNYMPQNLNPEIGLSGLCVKDKKIPYIFVNTRDGDEKPKILETSGRQIFTIICMLICIGINKFVFSTRTGLIKNKDYKKVYLLASEVLVPMEELTNISFKSLDDIRSYSKTFKVTPSMFLMCLLNAQKISLQNAKLFLEELKKSTKTITTPPNQPLPTNAYAKYNGERFSKEVVKAYKNKNIGIEELKNVLFRRGKMDNNLLQTYISKFSV